MFEAPQAPPPWQRARSLIVKPATSNCASSPIDLLLACMPLATSNRASWLLASSVVTGLILGESTESLRMSKFCRLAITGLASVPVSLK